MKLSTTVPLKILVLVVLSALDPLSRCNGNEWITNFALPSVRWYVGTFLKSSVVV